MGKYKHDQKDKMNVINRCYFDAELGLLSLCLGRLSDLYQVFPNDPQVEYAEALIRKDFMGQGIKAQEIFLTAQNHVTIKKRFNRNYVFTSFNSALFARNEEEFRKQEMIFRKLAPSDKDIFQLDNILSFLNSGNSYQEILASTSTEYAKEGKFGASASYAELALLGKSFSLEDELKIRKNRLQSLRELDKDAESSRINRGEDFPPEERLVLDDALKDLEIAISIDPYDHLLWNLKSAWLHLMVKNEEAIKAADMSLSLCPQGYLKPKTNKAICLEKLGRIEEAKNECESVIEEASLIGESANFDKELAKEILNGLNNSSLSLDVKLEVLSQAISKSAFFTFQKEMSQRNFSQDGKKILKNLKKRVDKVGNKWNLGYVKELEQLLQYTTAETVWIMILKLREHNNMASINCFFAALYLAAKQEGVGQRDACRLIIFIMLNLKDSEKIRIFYRSNILGLAAICEGNFIAIINNIKKEMERLSPNLVTLITDQPFLDQNEIDIAKKEFECLCINEYTSDSCVKGKSSLKLTLNKFFNNMNTPLLKKIFGRKSDHCYKCGKSMKIVKGMINTIDYMNNTKGCFICNSCGRITCYDCSDNRIPCKCGAKQWAERSYITKKI